MERSKKEDKICVSVLTVYQLQELFTYDKRIFALHGDEL